MKKNNKKSSTLKTFYAKVKNDNVVELINNIKKTMESGFNITSECNLNKDEFHELILNTDISEHDGEFNSVIINVLFLKKKNKKK